MKNAGAMPDQVLGIGVDFTSCTMLPAACRRHAALPARPFHAVPLAWPKLWKHHGAKAETDRINQVARERNEPWLARYGGTIGLEWFFPKVLETLDVCAARLRRRRGLARGRRLARLATDQRPVPALPRQRASSAPPARPVTRRCGIARPAIRRRTISRPSIRGWPTSWPTRCPARCAAPGQQAGELTTAAAELLGLRRACRCPPRSSTPTPACRGRACRRRRRWCMVMGTSSLPHDEQPHRATGAGHRRRRRRRHPARILRLRDRPGQRRRRLRLGRQNRRPFARGADAPRRRHCRPAPAACWRSTGSTAAAPR